MAPSAALCRAIAACLEPSVCNPETLYTPLLCYDVWAGHRCLGCHRLFRPLHVTIDRGHRQGDKGDCNSVKQLICPAEEGVPINHRGPVHFCMIAGAWSPWYSQFSSDKGEVREHHIVSTKGSTHTYIYTYIYTHTHTLTYTHLHTHTHSLLPFANPASASRLRSRRGSEASVRRGFGASLGWGRPEFVWN